MFSDEANNYSDLLDMIADYTPETQKEYTILLENVEGKTIIRAIFKNDLVLEDSTSESKDSDDE